MSNLEANAKQGDYERGKNHVIDNLGLLFQSSEHGNWIMKAGQIVRLSETVKKYNPKHILELGTGIGCSTAVLAFSSEASIYTVEQNQKCIDIAKKLIPQTLQERIYFRKATVQAVTVPQVNPFVSWSMYDEFDLLKGGYDFILVDGPGPWLTSLNVGGKYWPTMAELPNGDVLNLLPKMAEGTIVYVDGRKIATSLYNRHLGNYLEYLEGNREYAIYKRTGKQLNADFSNYENQDVSKDLLTKKGYFND